MVSFKCHIVPSHIQSKGIDSLPLDRRGTEVGGGDVVLGDSSGTSKTGWRRNCCRICDNSSLVSLKIRRASEKVFLCLT
jgi:hypothetical protein